MWTWVEYDPRLRDFEILLSECSMIIMIVSHLLCQTKDVLKQDKSGFALWLDKYVSF